MQLKRGSGILLHITSLPSPYGIGTLGREAYRFIDFLHRSGQRYWQMLPLGPTSVGDSPYQSFSSYAGNPYFIDLDLLAEEGLLQKEEIEAVFWGDDPGTVDYGTLYSNREPLLRKAFLRHRRNPNEDWLLFRQRNRHWLRDYSLFMALKVHFSMASWLDWDEQDIRLRRPEAMKRYRTKLAEEIEFQEFLQFCFAAQWEELKAYGKRRGIDLIGDLPIYVSLDSADVWTYPEGFQLDEQSHPLEVGGVPPDYFSATGQLWGNPLYNWEAMATDGYEWWMKRIAATAKKYDVIRIDHFRGLESYWSVPYGEPNAIKGRWTKGPGMTFVSRVKERFPHTLFIAEDLGILTEEVHQFLSDSGFPGMRVLQFAFDSGEDCCHLPHTYPENCIVYTGTHDNNTLKGWLNEAGAAAFTFARAYFRLDGTEDPVWRIIRNAMASVADLCIVPVQDYLGLSKTARMNTPSTMEGNWQWRLLPGRLTDTMADEILDLAVTYKRR